MATESKDVELRVRAKDYSEKTLTKVADSLEQLTRAQTDQVKAAKAGQVSAKELERSYAQLESATAALAKGGNLISVFNSQAAALAKAKDAADAARLAQTEYAKSMSGVETKTKVQIKTQRDLESAVKRADKAQITAQTNYDKTAQKLSNLGVAADQVGGAQQKIVTAVANGNAALERQSLAISTVDGDIRRSAALQAQAAQQKADSEAKIAAANKVAVESAKAAADWQQRVNVILNERDRSASEASKAEKAMADAMRKSAQQAEATTKGYQTLARSVSSVRGNELADQIRAINDPAAAAIKTLAGMSTALNALQVKVGAIKGPVQDFRNTMQELQAIQKNTSGVAAQIDAYRNQRAALQAAVTDYSKAGVAVSTLTAQMRAGGGDAQELARSMAAAQATFKAAATNVGEQTGKIKELRTALKDAGVNVRDLDAAEKQLLGTATQATNTLNNLTAAYKKHGAAVDDAGKKQFNFFKGGRTTLDYTQRLKGELLALATAYIGVQGAINLAKGSLDAFRTTQKIESQLGAVVGGDAAKIREEWDYLLATANRIGFSFEQAAPAYSKFAIAAKSFGFTGKETRYIFEQFAVAARVAGQSASEFEGILKAVEQMLSKGTIQAEELRGQLGDRLPGAFTIAAKASQMTTAEFSKAMEQGTISADYVINIARELGKTYTGIEKASSGLAAQEARFNNAAFEFQKALADGGFVKAYQQFLLELTDLLKSEQGAQLAKTLSGAFSTVVDVLRLLIENIEGVKVAFSILLGLAVGKWFFGGATAAIKFAGAIKDVWTLFGKLLPVLTGGAAAAAAVGTGATAAATGMGVMRIAMLGIIRLIPFIGTLVTAITAAAWAYDKLKSSKDAAEGKGPSVKGKLMNADGTPIDRGTEDPGTGGTDQKRAAAALAKTLEANQKKLDKTAKTARKQSAKDELSDRADLIKEEYNLYRTQAKNTVKDAEAQSKILKEIDKQEKQALATDQIKYDTEHAKAGEAAGKKEVTLKEQIKNELLRIQDDLAKQETKLDANSSFEDRKKTRVDAISHAYDKLKKNIATLSTLDKEGAADATKKLNAYIGQLQAVEAQKATLAEVKRLGDELEDQQKLRDSLLAQEQTKYDAGLTSQQEFLANTANINKQMEGSIGIASDKLQDFVDKAVKANASIMTLTEQASIKAITTTAKVGVTQVDNKNADSAIKIESQALDALIAKREAAEAIYKAQFDARMIGQDEYAAKVNAGAEAYKARTLEMIQAILKQIEAQRALGILNGTLSQERLAALDAQIAKMQQLGITIAGAQAQAGTFQQALNSALGSGVDSGLNALVTALTDLATGAKNGSEAFKALGMTVAQTIAGMLLDIGKAIAKQMILNALANSGNPYISAAGIAGGGVKAGVKHGGGTVGGANGRSRKVDPSWFTNAPRFHEGGLPGLKSDEVATILQKGEQVLDRDDPDNILNGGGRAAAGGGSNRFVLVDDQRRIAEALASSEGEKAQLVFLRKNAATVRQIVGK